jgi:hypothetical protein
VGAEDEKMTTSSSQAEELQAVRQALAAAAERIAALEAENVRLRRRGRSKQAGRAKRLALGARIHPWRSTAVKRTWPKIAAALDCSVRWAQYCYHEFLQAGFAGNLAN